MRNFNSFVTERFKVSPENISDTLSAKDVPEWDSMNYLLFIADLEKAYGISFSMDEVLGAQTLGDIRKMLLSRSIEI